MPPSEGNEELLDRQTLLERVGDDPELLAQMVQIYQSELTQMLENVRQAVQAGDAARLNSTAHYLKGATGNFSQGPAYALAHRLELLGKNQELATAGDVLAELEPALERLARALAHLNPE